MKHAALCCLVAALFGSSGLARNTPAPALKLARAFTDNAVLQHGQACPVFGVDLPGTRVTVAFAHQRLSAVAGRDGAWRVNLAPLAVSSVPRTLTVTGSSTLSRTNVLVGDVWLISGQSNADFPLRSSTGGGPEVASATNQLIRCYHLAESPRTDARAWSSTEVARLNPSDYFSAAWAVDNPGTASDISAVGYFFIREIARRQQVPLGLIDCSVGGTPAISWMPDSAIAAHPRLKAVAANYLSSEMVPAFVKTRILQNLALWDQAGRPAPMPEHPYKPGACWRNGLETIAPFALRGVLWYQGETDADFSSAVEFDPMAKWYTETFDALVSAWRGAWERADLPVYFVQLPQMNRPSWPWFRESQAECARRIRNTAMAVAYDYGQPNNVHPPDKRPVADRLALLARKHVYGEEIEASGPTLRSWQVSGRALVLEFEHAAGGLVSSDSQPLRYFEVAGADRHFFPATAQISNASIMVSAPEVGEPAAVRYAWLPAGNLNFFNGAGLPAPPFRTDRWSAVNRPLRVACIGDSITFGYGLGGTHRSYPARLQALLGAGYDVRNFGKTGATVTRDSFSHWARGFAKQHEYTNALAFQPDVVVCNLGINDVSTFADPQRQNLARDYGEIISAFRSLSTSARFVVWHPLAPLFPGQTYYGLPVVTNVNDLVRQAARQNGADTLDLFTPLLQRPEWFPDKLHPNGDGAQRIAEVVAQCLRQGLDAPGSFRPPDN